MERVESGSGSVIAEYYYDPFGRRLWKDVSGTRTCFHYSDEGLVGEYDVSGNEIKTYGWKPGSTWSTDPLFMKIGSEYYYYYHNDHIGTPQKMTSVSGAVIWSAIYDSFGKATINTGIVTNNLRFAGQYFDTETGLHYNYHRYYDPILGRYIRKDSIGLLGGINLFNYAQGNPVNTVDPSGEFVPHSIVVLLGAAYVACKGYNFYNEGRETANTWSEMYENASNADELYQSIGPGPDLQQQQRDTLKDAMEAVRAGGDLNDAISTTGDLINACK